MVDTPKGVLDVSRVSTLVCGLCQVWEQSLPFSTCHSVAYGVVDRSWAVQRFQLWRPCMGIA